MTRRTWLLVTAGAVAVALVVAVVTVVVLRDGDARDADFRAARGPGSVLTSRTVPGLPLSFRARRVQGRLVTYVSTGPDGRPTQVSGAVFTPGGTPPRGGWPVVSFAHGTTGIGQGCGPSAQPGLEAVTTAAGGYLASGYAVALTDYQGLGGSGVHPYLDPQTAGRNVIDVVRALRLALPGVSRRWVAVGGSQGGAAVWSADEQVAQYAPDLRLLGAAALAPPADLVGLVRAAQERRLTPEQTAALQLLLESRHRLDPRLRLDDFRTPRAAAVWDVLSSCRPADGARRGAALAALRPGDVGPQDAAAARTLTALLRRLALPRQRADAPLLVVYGTADPYIDAAWTTTAVARARRLGTDVQADLQPGKGHDDLDAAGLQTWVLKRLETR